MIDFVIQISGRLYEVDRSLVSIHASVLNAFREWNTGSFRNNVYYDRRMTQVLLICCIGAEKVAAGEVSERVKKFIEGKSHVHCGNSPFITLITF